MKLKTFLCILVASLLMSTMEVALKIAGLALDAFQLTFIRFFIGGLLLLPFAIIHIKKHNICLTKSDFAYMLGLGCCVYA